MAGQITINLDNAIESISILDAGIISEEIEQEKAKQINELSLRKQENELSSACKAFKMAIAKVNQFYGNIVARRGEEIAKLSIEIARKILVQKIEANDYEIESIITESLKNFQSTQDVVVHLNPDDYEQCKKIMEKDKSSIPSGVTLLADQNIGRAECILKSSKGTILSLINDQLEQIENALKRTQ